MFSPAMHEPVQHRPDCGGVAGVSAPLMRGANMSEGPHERSAMSEAVSLDKVIDAGALTVHSRLFDGLALRVLPHRDARSLRFRNAAASYCRLGQMQLRDNGGVLRNPRCDSLVRRLMD